MKHYQGLLTKVTAIITMKFLELANVYQVGNYMNYGFPSNIF